MKLIKTLMILIAFLSTNLTALLHLNNTDEVFPDESQSKISENMVNGASTFLSSYSEALILVDEAEMSSMSRSSSCGFLQRLESVITKLEAAKNYYDNALVVAIEVGYIQILWERLVSFDYEGFIQRENLNKTVADKVIYYLRRGDVTGLYKENIENITNILTALKNLKSNIEAGTTLETDTLHSIYIDYSENILFGNYATIISINALGVRPI